MKHADTMNAIVESPAVTTRRGWPGYNAIWRWHFYAGLFCLPFILVLSITGAVYLFNPQIEAQINRPYDHLTMTGTRASVEAQVTAAIAAVPGSVLNSYELPATLQSAVRVRVGRGSDLFRVYVHPETLEILKQEPEDWRLMRVVHRLHGELLLGDRGSMIVELAASWTIVMFITGLYLWWPRTAQGLAGIVYPRFNRGNRVFWRDLHAVTGLWISFFVLFLLISGLPWAKSWGGMLKEVRQIGASTVVKQDWTTGRSSELDARREMNTQAAAMSEHAGHNPADRMSPAKQDYSAIDRLVAIVQPLQLAPPVLISPPSIKSPEWTARSDAQNRPLRVNLVLDGRSGAIKSRKDFADRPLLDRVIGVGIAAHEGQLFGWPNQVLGVITALGLLLMTASSVVLWWRRRSPGTLGAPHVNRVPARFSYWLIAVIMILGVLLPLLGISMLVVACIERSILRYFPSARKYLGLDAMGGTEVLAHDLRTK